MSIRRTLSNSVKSSATVQKLRSPGEIKPDKKLNAAINARVKKKAAAKKNEAKAAAKTSKANASETKKVVAADTKAQKKQHSRDSKPASNPYSGRKDVIDTPHGPAVDLDKIDKPVKPKKVK
jgi:hypothetical protein